MTPAPDATRAAGERVSVDAVALEALKAHSLTPCGDLSRTADAHIDAYDDAIDALLATAAPLPSAVVGAGMTEVEARALVDQYAGLLSTTDADDFYLRDPEDRKAFQSRLRHTYSAIVLALATAAQPARAVPDRRAVEAALGTIADAARRAVRYYDDDDEQDAAFERIDIASERVLALIFPDAPADASEAVRDG